MNSDSTNETVVFSRTETEDGTVSYHSSERPTVTVALPHGWARALLAGLEAALFGWLVPVLAFVGSYLSVSSNTWLKDYVIGTAARLGTDFWASSLGSPFQAGPLTITLVPLLWTGLQVVALRILLLAVRTFDANAVWLAVPGYVISSVLIAALASANASVLYAALGAVGVSAVACLWAYARQTEVFPKWIRRLGWLWSGVRTGLLWLAVTFALGLVLLIASLIVSWPAVAQARQDLTGGGGAGLLLASIEGAYLPDFAGWAIAWLSGAGFTLVGGELFSVGNPATPPEPFLPVVAAVPQTAPGAWTAAVLVALGVAFGLLSSVRYAERTLPGAAKRMGVALAVFAVSTYLWMAASSGSIGAAELVNLGPTPLAWLRVTAMIGGTAVLVALLLHPETRAAIGALALRKPVAVAPAAGRAQIEETDGTISSEP